VGDPAVTLADKQVHRIYGRLFVVGEYHVHFRMLDMLAQCHYRDSALIDDLVKLLVGEMKRYHDDPIDRAAHDRLTEIPLIFGVMICIGEQHIVPVRASSVVNGAHNRMVEWVGDVSDHDGDHAGVLRPQAAGRHVWAELELLSSLKHTLAGSGANRNAGGRAGEHTGNRTLRHASKARYIAHRHRP